MKGSDKVKVPQWDGTEGCAGIGVELFYDEDRRTQQQNVEHLSQLRAICSACKRLDECREYAIKHEYYGFWGGMTVTERIHFRRKFKIKLVRPEMYSEAMPDFARGKASDSFITTTNTRSV